ncbi:MAG: amidohydrolase family protein [bacterium]
MRPKLIRGRRLIDGTGREPLDDPVIVVSDGIIKSIGRGAEGGPEAGEFEEIDAPDKTIMPGLIDGHLHLAWGSPDDPVWADAEGDPAMTLLWAVRGAQWLLLDGVTTARDCGGPAEVIFALKDGIESGLIPGPRLLVSGPCLTTTAGHCHFFGGIADTAEELRKAVRSIIARGADFIKIMATGGSTTPTSNRRRAQYTAHELSVAVKDAHRLNRRVVAHCNATEGIRNSVEAGVDTIAHCNWLGKEEGTIEYDGDVVKAMAERGIFVDLNIEAVFTPLSARDGSAQEWGERTRWDLIREMIRAGVRVFLSSDAVGISRGRFPSLLVRMVREGRATPQEVLSMATRIPAEAMGLGKSVGTVEVGKVADLIFLDGDPLEDICALLRVDTVIRGGRTAVSQGKLVPH